MDGNQDKRLEDIVKAGVELIMERQPFLIELEQTAGDWRFACGRNVFSTELVTCVREKCRENQNVLGLQFRDFGLAIEEIVERAQKKLNYNPDTPVEKKSMRQGIAPTCMLTLKYMPS